jgi:hypothetical protein
MYQGDKSSRSGSFWRKRVLEVIEAIEVNETA